jgi:hypothetical protein
MLEDAKDVANDCLIMTKASALPAAVNKIFRRASGDVVADFNRVSIATESSFDALPIALR